MNKNIYALSLGILVVISAGHLYGATSGDYLNSKPTFGDRISRGTYRFFSGRTDENHLTAKPPYTERVSEKLGRGLTNFFLGPYEIKKSYTEEYERNNLLASACTTGLLKGTFRSVKRMAVGAYEFFTSPIPQDPIILPEYVTDRSF